MKKRMSKRKARMKRKRMKKRIGSGRTQRREENIQTWCAPPQFNTWEVEAGR